MTGRPVDAETGTASCPFFSGAVRRVVLDTNVLVSLWIFADSRYAPLRTALEDGLWRALSNEACCGEFARVLGYPQFALPPERQQTALAEYRRLAEFVTAVPQDPAPLPRCQDRDDQKFLELARDGKADWLVTADRALLVLARRQKLAHLFRILTPDAALEALRA
ncbi:MAG: putative toxin-antitoxin system toxin component, PIN family [Rhodocyclaceae bacterium]|nr:putative toxin-antitoxin system toxin component, PIN family [Rhodocyclaceae bacterium]